jgi:hypothetical protein
VKLTFALLVYLDAFVPEDGECLSDLRSHEQVLDWRLTVVAFNSFSLGPRTSFPSAGDEMFGDDAQRLDFFAHTGHNVRITNGWPSRQKPT